MIDTKQKDKIYDFILASLWWPLPPEESRKLCLFKGAESLYVSIQKVLENPQFFINEIIEWIFSNKIIEDISIYISENSIQSSPADVCIFVMDERKNEAQSNNIKDDYKIDDYKIIVGKEDEDTNFTYRIERSNLTDKEIEDMTVIDTCDNLIDCIKQIKRNGGSLIFDHVDNETFSDKLQMLDGDLSKTIAQLLLEQLYTGWSKLTDLVKALAVSNPLKFDEEVAGTMYDYKLKHFLTFEASEIIPSQKLHGRYNWNGGYLVERKDGEILCFHFYEMNAYEDYLFNNSYLAYGKTGKHGYASLYRGEDGKVYFKLNLQIRLK